MPKTKTKAPRIPKLRHHKHSGRAFIEVQGRRHYLGKWGTAATVSAYHRILGELAEIGSIPPRVTHEQVSVAEVISAFLIHCKSEYSPKEYHRVWTALRAVDALYGTINAVEFGPLALKVVRRSWVDEGYARPTCNVYTNVVRRCFKWAAGNQLIPGSIHADLKCVQELRKGRTEAWEPEPILPVSVEHVEAAKAHAAPVVQAMIDVQYLSACRPGEIVQLSKAMIDTTGDVWTAKIEKHKTEYRGRERVLYFGTKAQTILREYMVMHPDGALFLSRLGKPFTVSGYAQAIERACKAANKNKPEGERTDPWTPNRLRHTAATLIREKYGLEAAQTVLGHASADVTQIYALRNAELAKRVIGEIG